MTSDEDETRPAVSFENENMERWSALREQRELKLSNDFYFTTRWGSNTLKTGFTAVPNFLIKINRYAPQSKKLRPSEMVVLVTILSYWWDANRLPFPSISRLSQDTGLSRRQLKRIIKSLEEKNYFKINKLKGAYQIASNEYDPSPLVDFINRLSIHELNKTGKPNPESQYLGKLTGEYISEADEDDTN